jgi:hypothetical protein
MPYKPSAAQDTFKTEVDKVLTRNASNIKLYKEDLNDEYYVTDVDDLSDEEAKHLYFYILCKFHFPYSLRTHPLKVKTFMDHAIKMKYNLNLLTKAIDIVAKYKVA